MARLEQIAYREDHRRDNALGIASAASPDVLVVFARGEEWRHSVHVRGERDRWFPPPGENVVAPGLDGDQLGMPAILRGKLGQVGEEHVAHLLFVLGDGFDIHQRARKFENVHSIPISS